MARKVTVKEKEAFLVLKGWRRRSLFSFAICAEPIAIDSWYLPGSLEIPDPFGEFDSFQTDEWRGEKTYSVHGAYRRAIKD